MKIQLSADILWNFYLFILTGSAFLRLLFWGKNGKFQEGVFVFIVAILSSAAPGLRTIKGEVLDIFSWNLHTLCNLLFPMSWQRVFQRKLILDLVCICELLKIRILEFPIQNSGLNNDFLKNLTVTYSGAPHLRWLTGEMSQNLIFPLNVIIIFLYISSFQYGLNDLSIPRGCLVVVSTLLRRGSGVCQHNIYIWSVDWGHTQV